MTRSLLLASAVALAPVMLAAAPPVVPGAPPAAPATQKAALAAFFDSYDKAQLDRSPMGKAYRGIRDADYGKWDDLSDAAATADIAATNDALATMRGTFPRAGLDDDDQLSYDLFEQMAQRRSAAFRFRDDGYVFDQMNGAQSQLPAFLINIHRVTSKADAEAYVSRLNAIGAVMDQAMGLAKARAAKGVLPPKWVSPTSSPTRAT